MIGEDDTIFAPESDEVETDIPELVAVEVEAGVATGVAGA